MECANKTSDRTNNSYPLKGSCHKQGRRGLCISNELNVVALDNLHTFSADVERSRVFIRGRDISLGENPIRIRSAEDISSSLGHDCCCTSIENHSTTSDSNSDQNIVQFNVAERERTSEVSAARLGGSNENRSVGDYGVNDCLSPSRLPRRLC